MGRRRVGHLDAAADTVADRRKQIRHWAFVQLNDKVCERVIGSHQYTVGKTVAINVEEIYVSYGFPRVIGKGTRQGNLRSDNAIPILIGQRGAPIRTGLRALQRPPSDSGIEAVPVVELDDEVGVRAAGRSHYTVRQPISVDVCQNTSRIGVRIDRGRVNSGGWIEWSPGFCRFKASPIVKLNCESRSRIGQYPIGQAVSVNVAQQDCHVRAGPIYISTIRIPVVGVIAPAYRAVPLNTRPIQNCAESSTAVQLNLISVLRPT